MIFFSLLLYLLSLRFGLAAYPHIWFPDYFETDPKFKADYPTWKGVVDQAFQDAITLARVVVLTGNSCDPAFLRYFQKQDYNFVQALFRKIANIPASMNTGSPEEVLALLQSTNPAASFGPVWDKLLLSFTDYPQSPWDIGSLASCNMQGVNGYLNYDGKAPREANDPAWPELFKGIPTYMQVIEEHQFGPQIADYIIPGPFPDPYGPFNAASLAKFPADKKTGYSLAIQNAENYVWYANSKYWAWKCNRPFAAATTEADNMFNQFRARGPPMYGTWNQPLPDS
ncbi:uncharacterized protein Z520_08217 [Fonsecaea multimorphosa CBS 102226]|uniref:Uncharacterized protein n=1 Tax=Fonsecaea multimorphosa CBS 102226 TaxID=1442371 RepID=A0A0D2JRD7_9EURO|nr:uncharacterized protein Z520_08217 [Fonsecaea multimorphosa CBS 102226]KIX95962.1 hypothetical protein Z520_08217 [Fonsecaea multimorphosa CBS 102226]